MKTRGAANCFIKRHTDGLTIIIEESFSNLRLKCEIWIKSVLTKKRNNIYF